MSIDRQMGMAKQQYNIAEVSQEISIYIVTVQYVNN